MSWDVTLGMRFIDHKDPVERFLEVATAFAASDKYDTLCELQLAKGIPPKTKPLVNIRTIISHDPPIPFSQVQELKQKFQGEDIRVTGSWLAQQRYMREPPDPTPISTTYGVEVIVFGQEYRRHPLYPPGYDLFYDANNSLFFNTRIQGETARLNIDALVREVPLFIELGAATIRGLNVDMSPYPPDTYLCYHHDPALYGQDLELILERPPASPIRTEQVLHAAIMSSDLDYLATAGEPIIYHADLANSDLAEFYHELYLTTL